MAIQVIRPNQKAAAAVFIRLIERNAPDTDPHWIEYLRLASEGAIAYTFYLDMRSRCQFLEPGHDLLTCALRAVCTDYTRSYLERGCRIAVALAGNKGRAARELKCQRRDLLECFCR
jgi:hypothetical protein